MRECIDLIIRMDWPDFEGVGVNYVDRFIERHHDELRVYHASPLDSIRGQAVNPVTLEQFFSLLKAEYLKHQFAQHNIYGGDESALMSGVTTSERVIGAVGKKTQWQQRPANRENTTLIVTICADGTSLPPMLIMKGSSYMVRWAQNNPLKAS
jgi:hypothetical protein